MNRPSKNQKSLYGLSDEDFSPQLAAQNNRCAICEMVFGQGAGRPEVDHDHDLSRLRGLLCSKCNKMLGLAQDDPEVLKRAAAYLQKFFLGYLDTVPWEQRERHIELLFNVKKAGRWQDKNEARLKLEALMFPDDPRLAKWRQA